MNLKIHVSDAAYVDKSHSDSIMYELVPHYDLEEQSPVGKSRRPAWLLTPCLRQGEQLQTLHHQIVRNHPNFFLPSFPSSKRSAPGWGSDAYLLRMRRRLERYFERILMRPELQEELSSHDFTSEETTHGATAEGRTVGLWRRLSRGWFSSSGNLTKDLLLEYTPQQSLDWYDAGAHSSIKKNIELREGAMKSTIESLQETLSAVENVSAALGLVGRSLNDLTSCHVRHLIRQDTDTSTESLSGMSVSFQDDLRAGERRFRELGDRFLDLVNQLQPGLDKIIRETATCLGEVSLEQLEELGHLRHYVNREVRALHEYDDAMTRRLELERRRDAILAEGPSQGNQLVRIVADYDRARAQEFAYATDYKDKAAVLKQELDLYWQYSSHEFFKAILHSLHVALETNRVHADVLRAWFPPTEL